MAKAAKKPAAKSAVSKKPEKKTAAPKKEAKPKAEAAAKKAAAPVEAETEVEAPVAAIDEAPAAPKLSKKEKAAKAAAEKVNAEDFKKWSDLKDKHGSEKASAYSMSGTFEANQPILHKLLGWGYILNVQNDRLEVLFENGPKMLISNYKPR